VVLHFVHIVLSTFREKIYQIHRHRSCLPWIVRMVLQPLRQTGSVLPRGIHAINWVIRKDADIADGVVLRPSKKNDPCAKCPWARHPRPHSLASHPSLRRLCPPRLRLLRFAVRPAVVRPHREPLLRYPPRHHFPGRRGKYAGTTSQYRSVHRSSTCRSRRPPAPRSLWPGKCTRSSDPPQKAVGI